VDERDRLALVHREAHVPAACLALEEELEAAERAARVGLVFFVRAEGGHAHGARLDLHTPEAVAPVRDPGAHDLLDAPAVVGGVEHVLVAVGHEALRDQDEAVAPVAEAVLEALPHRVRQVVGRDGGVTVVRHARERPGLARRGAPQRLVEGAHAATCGVLDEDARGLVLACRHTRLGHTPVGQRLDGLRLARPHGLRREHGRHLGSERLILFGRRCARVIAAACADRRGHCVEPLRHARERHALARHPRPEAVERGHHVGAGGHDHHHQTGHPEVTQGCAGLGHGCGRRHGRHRAWRSRSSGRGWLTGAALLHQNWK
jgi:hypothetical protein